MATHDSSKTERAQISFGAFSRKPVERAASTGTVDLTLRAESAESWPDDAVEVGVIVDSYGLKGWVKVAAHADAGRGGDALLTAPRWWLLKDHERRSTGAQGAKVHGDSVVVALGGVTDRDAALLMRGTRVYICRSDFPALEADEFYWVDLLGLDVVNEVGVALGTVAGMIDNGAHSVLRVAYQASGVEGKNTTAERLIPFVGVYVKAVDQAAKQITVDWEADY
ncbi:ribosome maturation factor RimM [Paraburkholderia bonniea]|uniref:ribosome maturation factor RimM n=1 Tax=Paraburkholderia bonniea TaxID=2152891 RepID=UPI0012921623|nr:ribosome maturation factor RimM [Paraburkholderia bonniea]